MKYKIQTGNSKGYTTPGKGWMNQNGEFISFGNNSDVHHVQIVINHPHLFGTSKEELSKLESPERISKLSAPELTNDAGRFWSEPIFSHVGNKGWMRFENQTWSSKRTPSEIDRGEPATVHHSFDLTNHGDNISDETFKNSVKNLYDHIQTVANKKDQIDIALHGPHVGRSHPNFYYRSLNSINDVRQFIGLPPKSKFGEINSPQVRDVTSTDIRNALPMRAPENIPGAIWKNIRNLGDSYMHLKNQYKNILLEARKPKIDPRYGTAKDPRLDIKSDEAYKQSGSGTGIWKAGLGHNPNVFDKPSNYNKELRSAAEKKAADEANRLREYAKREKGRSREELQNRFDPFTTFSTREEIANVMGLSNAQVDRSIKSALEKIKKALGPEFKPSDYTKRIKDPS